MYLRHLDWDLTLSWIRQRSIWNSGYHFRRNHSSRNALSTFYSVPHCCYLATTARKLCFRQAHHIRKRTNELGMTIIICYYHPSPYAPFREERNLVVSIAMLIILAKQTKKNKTKTQTKKTQLCNAK